MNDIHAEYSAFRAKQSAEVANARQTAALHLVCGIDLSSALTAEPELKAKLALRLERAIERERLRGMRRHWSYDLNRHMALKQALDRLRGAEPADGRDNHVARRVTTRPNAKRRPKAPLKSI
nr:cytoplasmic protein [Mesorhizobium soli]